METPDFEHGRVYFKQFGAERVAYNGITTSFTKVVYTHCMNELPFVSCNSLFTLVKAIVEQQLFPLTK